MTMFADAGEVHPETLVTVKLWVPDVNPVTTQLAPVPDITPGFSVQPPEGSPFNSTLPVATVHVGWVIVPIVGATGVEGCTLITTFADATEVHPAELVTVKV
jgi:hypothetical protein